jgi:dihydroflavonol-4-reductase
VDLGIRCESGNIGDAASVERAIQGQDVVIHAAYDRGGTQPGALPNAGERDLNLDGVKNVIAACEKFRVRRLVHVSSVAAIGIPRDPARPAREDFRSDLDKFLLDYHRSKRLAEEMVMAAASRGLDAVVVNPASIFGPFGAGYRGMQLIEQVRTATILPYFSGGICTVHVLDVVDGILAAIDKGLAGNRYILGGENISYRDLFRRTAAALKVRPFLVPVPRAASRFAAILCEPWGRLRKKPPKITYAAHYFAHRHHFYDSSKARSQLMYTPRSFQAILDECVDFLEQTLKPSGRRLYEPHAV